MLSHEIVDTQNAIHRLLSQKHLQQAFAELRKLTQQLNEWSASEKLNELETSYRYMIQYMLDGVKDPKRVNIYHHLVMNAYHLTDTVCEKLLWQNSASLYFGLKRNTQNMTLAQAFAALDNSVSELSLSELYTDEDEKLHRRRQVESLSRDFFNRVWTNFPAEAEDYAILREALQPQRVPDAMASLIVSALTLNLQHAFDEEKINILLDAYVHHNHTEVQMRALCGVFLAIMQYHNLFIFSDKLQNRISLLYDEQGFITDLRNILFQFIRSRDTEKIARKMTEEVLPNMMKISPTLYKKIKEEDALSDIEALEQNPEWQELIEKSGVADRLRELNDLQMEGADVFMSTFSHLKGFPFFNEISNWFLPFMTQHTELAKIFGEEEWSRRFAQLLDSSGFLCNSDKYSFCLSLSQVPEAQRRMMASQFKDESIAMHEAEQTELYKKSHERENISNRYIQDLYRFGKLFPRRNEFCDLFAMPVNELLQIEELSPVLQETSAMRVMGEYFFKHEDYIDAAYIFVLLSADDYTDYELFQKTGYCFQSTENYEEALEYYLKADIIKPNNLWTLRHIAICYRNMKKCEMSLQYFLRAAELAPESIAINLNIGHCYLEQKKYEDALQYYFKVDYLDSKGTKARRPIAWCSFLVGKKEQAMRYYEKILDDKPTALDYLNTGHVVFAMGDIRRALSLYLKSIHKENGSIARFAQSFEQDIPDLIHAGISPDDIPILYDQVIYKAQEEREA